MSWASAMRPNTSGPGAVAHSQPEPCSRASSMASSMANLPTRPRPLSPSTGTAARARQHLQVGPRLRRPGESARHRAAAARGAGCQAMHLARHQVLGHCLGAGGTSPLEHLPRGAAALAVDTNRLSYTPHNQSGHEGGLWRRARRTEQPPQSPPRVPASRPSRARPAPGSGDRLTGPVGVIDVDAHVPATIFMSRRPHLMAEVTCDRSGARTSTSTVGSLRCRRCRRAGSSCVSMRCSRAAMLPLSSARRDRAAGLLLALIK